MSVRVNTETGELVDDGQLRSAGSSTVVTIPPDILSQAEMSAGDDVEFAVDLDSEGKIVIREEDGDEA
ncbi:hypothetical protein HJIV1_gp11 [Haloterrigena jeotgali icosahedral virus 1]|nr:hypothetical protein HJIV1_gp11 [Haloterrigena jeotgali icosahedral virus 1]